MPPESDAQPAVPVFFLSDSTGISAETMGNALLIQFPDLRFERRLIPFITTVEEAQKVVAILDKAAAGPVTPDRKSTRLNSSHANISYAVFCLKKNNRLEPLRLSYVYR